MKNKLTLQDVEWGIFKIGDIFSVSKVLGRPLEEYDKGDIPYASTSSMNNAVIGFVNASSKDISPSNVISVDPIKGKVLYHPYEFVGRGFSGASINILINKNINKHSALFICKCIENSSTNKASYGYLFNSNRLLSGMFKLPIDCCGNPNWQFMEDYIKQEQKEITGKVVNYYQNKLDEILENATGGGVTAD